MRSLTILAIGVCLVFGCARPGQRRQPKAAEIVTGVPVKLDLLRLGRVEFSLRQAKLALSARLTNPNTDALFASKARVVVELNGVRFDVPEQVLARKIAGGQTSDWVIPLTIDFRRTGDSLYIAIARKVLDVRVEGEAAVRSRMGARTDRVEAQGRMAVDEASPAAGQ
ncbi:hypothetical protein HQ560_19445 [bacterium]|nr:hypothetical protein [bacterium]